MSDTVFRPDVVRDFQKQDVTASRKMWQLHKIVTWAFSLGAGYTILMWQEWPGDRDTGHHGLTTVRNNIRGVVEGLLTGDWSQPFDDLPPKPTSLLLQPVVPAKYLPPPVTPEPPLFIASTGTLLVPSGGKEQTAAVDVAAAALPAAGKGSR